ncbi:MAG TPA: hypothetical protein VKE92_06240 [Anaerolineales bacterium]|nr:hypothetical protein [Anaerolineales bacterium]
MNTNTPVNALFSSTTYNTYGSSAHKHAVTGLSTGETYTYDANGNMITRVEGGLTYTQTFRHALLGSQCNALDAENGFMSVTVSGQTTQFIYNGDGNPSIRLRHSGQVW